MSWTVSESTKLYRIDRWGKGYFRINAQGRLEVQPERDGRTLDLLSLVDAMETRGIDAPILFRFDGILKERVRYLQEVFHTARVEYDYQGKYHLAYPIKVNQQFHLVDLLRQSGGRNPLALEVGSKPELLAALAIHTTPNGILLCNGYKDLEYIELAVLATKLGRRTIVILEQVRELDTVIQACKTLNGQVELGIRMRPSTSAVTRWGDSAGDKAKFGLRIDDIRNTIQRLVDEKLTHCLKLLHFHVGSQISSIASIKKVLKEAARMYTEVASLCPSMCYLDVGGGLGVDYDGTRSSGAASINYTEAEYARDIVYTIGETCDLAGINHPDIISESGRALVAHHSVLVTEVTGVSAAVEAVPKLEEAPSQHERLQHIRELYDNLSTESLHETLHDTIELKDELVEEFIRGDISLVERAFAERALRHLIAKIRQLSKEYQGELEELDQLQTEINDLYFCNFSIFQSMPDYWAIDQLFPIMPIHRLDEKPSRQGVIADLTCDSDGVVKRFIGPDDEKHSLELHPFSPDKPYYLGVFLVGAYQEILGDMHNLFGDTNAVHVDIRDDGTPIFSHVVEGDSVREVLEYVEFSPAQLLEMLRTSIERALEAGTLRADEARFLQRRYRDALDGYTYMVQSKPDPVASDAKAAEEVPAQAAQPQNGVPSENGTAQHVELTLVRK